METKLNILEATGSSNESSMLSTISNEFQTPSTKHDKLINKLKTDLIQKLIDEHENINEINNSIIEKHTNLNNKFNLTLKLNEMNKICKLLKLNFEFKLSETYDINRRLFKQVIYCVKTTSNLAAILNFTQFDEKSMQLREFYSRFIEDVS